MLLTELEIRSLIAEALILESSKKKFTKDIIEAQKMSEEDFLEFFWDDRRNKWRHPFSNDIYRSMVYNSILADENHTLQEYKEGFVAIDAGIITPYFQAGQNIKPVLNPDGTVLEDIDPKIKSSTATYDEASSFIDAKNKTDRGTNVMQNIIDTALAKRANTDLDLIYQDDNWIFFYPKSYNGSIAVSRMGGDLKYYGNAVHKDSSIGRIPWCIAPDTTGNMFLNYHRRLNLHMYIGTKVGSRYNNRDKERKVCFSFSKRGGHVSLMSGNSTVNAENTDLNYESANRIVGTKIFEILSKDAEKPERLEIDPVSYYKSITLIQYENLENAIDSENEVDLERFMGETSEMAKNTERPDLLAYIYRRYVNNENARKGIHKNPMFGREFLSQFQDGEIYRDHFVLVDEKKGSEIIENTLVSSKNIDRLGWSEKRDLSSLFSLIAKSDVSKMSVKAKSIIVDIAKASITADYWDWSDDWREDSLYIIENNLEIKNQFFNSISREELEEVLTRRHRSEIVNNSLVISRHLYPDRNSVESIYRSIKKSKKESFRSEKVRPTMANNLKIIEIPFAVSEEAIVDIIDSVEYSSLDANFLGSIFKSVCLGNQKINFSYSEDVKNKVKEAFLNLLKSNGIGFRQMIFSNIVLSSRRSGLAYLTPIETADLYYQSFKDVQNFDKVDIDSLLAETGESGETKAAVIFFADRDRNYSFIAEFVKAKTRNKSKNDTSIIGDNNSLFLESALRSLLGSPEDENINELIIQICIKMSSQSDGVPAEGKAWALNKIKNNIDSFDERLVNCIGIQSSSFTGEENEIINNILASKNQEAKESLLLLLSLTAKSRHHDYDGGEESERVISFLAETIINNIDEFYLDEKKLVKCIIKIFPILKRDQKLSFVYCDQFDENKNLRTRRASGEALISEIRRLLELVNHNVQSAHDLELSDKVNLMYLVQNMSVLITQTKDEALNIYKGYTPSQRDYINYSYKCQKVIKKIEIEDYFDKSAYAIDMNKNKLLFEFYFNLSDELYKINKSIPVDTIDDDVYISRVVLICKKVEEFFNSQLGSELPFGKNYRTS